MDISENPNRVDHPSATVVDPTPTASAAGATAEARPDVALPLDPTPESPPEATTPTPPSRRGRANAMLLAATAVFLVGAVVLGGLGWRAFADASNARRDASVATSRRVQSAALRRVADHRRQALDTSGKKVGTTFVALVNALNDQVQAQNHLVDVQNAAVAVYNAGDTAGSVAAFQNQGAAALADLTAKTKTVHDDMTAVETAVKNLQEALRD